MTEADELLKHLRRDDWAFEGTRAIREAAAIIQGELARLRAELAETKQQLAAALEWKPAAIAVRYDAGRLDDVHAFENSREAYQFRDSTNHSGVGCGFTPCRIWTWHPAKEHP